MKSAYKRGWFQESYRHYLSAKGIATRRYNAVRLPGFPGNYEGTFNIGEQLWQARARAKDESKRRVATFEDDARKRAAARSKLAEEQLFGRLTTPEEAMQAATALMGAYLKQGAEVRLRDQYDFQGVENSFHLIPGVLYEVVYGEKEVSTTPLFTKDTFEFFKGMSGTSKENYKRDMVNRIMQARAEVGRTKNQAVVAENDAAKVERSAKQGGVDESELAPVRDAKQNMQMLYVQAQKRLDAWEKIKREMEDSMSGAEPEDLRSKGPANVQQPVQNVQSAAPQIRAMGKVDKYSSPDGPIEVYTSENPAELERMYKSSPSIKFGKLQTYARKLR